VLDRTPVVTAVSCQANGSLIAIVGDNHQLSLYDQAAGQFVHNAGRHLDWIRAARFSPNGQHLVTAGNDRQLLVWSAPSFNEPRTLGRHDCAIAAVAIDSQSRRIATVGFDDELRIYDMTSGQLTQTLTCPSRDMRAVAFSTDDRYVAAGGRDGVIRVWEAGTGGVVADIAAHRGRVRSLEFAGDGRIVSCGEDGGVCVTDVANPTAPLMLGQDRCKLFCVKLLDGGLLAAGGSDNAIYIWELQTGTLVGSLRGHDGTVCALDCRGAMLVSGSYDTDVRLWTTERIASLAVPMR
jgi:WD40 repeat protein